MSSAASEVRASLQRCGVDLHVSGGQVHYRCAVGALSPQLRAAASERRADLLAIIEAEAIDTVRRLWPWLLGTMPVEPDTVFAALAHGSGDNRIAPDVGELREALLALVPADNPTAAFDRLVEEGLLARDQAGRLYPRLFGRCGDRYA